MWGKYVSKILVLLLTEVRDLKKPEVIPSSPLALCGCAFAERDRRAGLSAGPAALRSVSPRFRSALKPGQNTGGQHRTAGIWNGKSASPGVPARDRFMWGVLPHIPVSMNFGVPGLKFGGGAVKNAFPQYRVPYFRRTGLGELPCRTGQHGRAGSTSADDRGSRA